MEGAELPPALQRVIPRSTIIILAAAGLNKE